MGSRAPAPPPDAKPWGRLDYVLLGSITAVGAVLRIVRLGVPAAQIFDEGFYARDACWYVSRDAAGCGLIGIPPEVHPPLGKWLIGAGIELFGFDPFGGRIAPAIAGIITIALVYLLARRLTRSSLAATVASGLLAIDFLHVVHSRIATLDVFVTIFSVGAVLTLVYDRDHLVEGRRGLRRRPWRVVTGILLGAAVASKWSGFFVLAAAIVLSLLWEMAVRKDRGQKHPLDAAVRADALPLAVYYVAVPLAVYALTHLGRFDGALLAWPWSPGSWWSAVWDQQRFMYDYLLHELPPHPYQSDAWTWPLSNYAFRYFFDIDDSTGLHAEVLAAGNPIAWAPACIAVFYAATRWYERRDHLGPGPVIVVMLLFTWGPWVFFNLTGRAHFFLYYFTLSVPFLLLASGQAVAVIWHAASDRVRPGGRAVVAAYLIAVLASFVYVYPLLTAVRLDPDAWRARSGLFDTCPAHREGDSLDVIARLTRACE